MQTQDLRYEYMLYAKTIAKVVFSIKKQKYHVKQFRSALLIEFKALPHRPVEFGQLGRNVSKAVGVELYVTQMLQL